MVIIEYLVFIKGWILVNIENNKGVVGDIRGLSRKKFELFKINSTLIRTQKSWKYPYLIAFYGNFGEI